MKPTVKSTMKSTVAVEMVEVVELRVMETIDKREPRPAAIVPVRVIPVVTGPV
jgi:hypothetical protein